MKTFKLILFSMVVICTFSSFKAPKNSPVAINGKLQVNGTQLCNQNGEAIMLRGASFGWHNLWPRFYNKKAVAWLAADWKCNVVRASMGVGLDDSYLENPEYALKCMTNVIDGAIKQGIYVLIDFHSHKLHTAEAKTFFSQIATKYKDAPNVIYEIWNEPDYYTWPEVKAYSEELIKTIRAIDPDNIILVGSPHWDQDIHLVAEDPIKGQSNLMYTMHFYAGTHKQWLRDRTDANNVSPAHINGPNIYTISAMGTSDLWASYSNFGNPPVDYCAPGSSIYSTYKGDTYATLSGTSMATPHVCGLLLLGTIRTDGYVSGDPDKNADPIAHK